MMESFVDSNPVETRVTCEDWRRSLPDLEALILVAVKATLSCRAVNPAIAFEDTEISLLLTDDTHMRQLNVQFRGEDRPTNVLAFPGANEVDHPVRALGDIVLAYESVDTEAIAQDKKIADHFTHLIVHGLLHLLGYDHQCDQDAEGMETLEVQILAALGITDPYTSAGRSVADD